MQSTPILIAVYVLPLLTASLGWAWHHGARSRRNRATLARNRAAGLAEPPALHPRIDPARCIGCGACVRACPEADVIGLIGRTATLIAPWACVGHGVCRDACPTQAISLVFGTTTQGLVVPVLGPGGETSVAGVYVAGELGGQALIANAIDQGRATIDHIAAALRADPAPADEGRYDVVIVGCGPAGLSAALGAMGHGLRHVALDQASLGGSIAHYPRGKLVMTARAHLPVFGPVQLGTISKEGLLAFWQGVLDQTGLAPRFGERVDRIERDADGFVVVSDQARYRTRRIVLALGRGGSPRRLNIPGEDLAKVVYRLTDPGQYAGQRVMVVGSGDSAVEAALAVARVAGTTVTLVHRARDLARASADNRAAVRALASTGGLRVLPAARPTAIAPASVTVTTPDGPMAIPNDTVIICAGGTIPRDWLAQIGIALETRHGHPGPDNRA